jgi:hypothetical protein
MRTLALAVVVLCAGIAPPPADAQTRADGPYEGLFGGTGKNDQTLTFRTSFGGGYDDTVLTGASRTGPDQAHLGRRNRFGTGSADLTYGLTRTRIGLSAGASAMAAYYPVLRQQQVVGRYRANVGAWFDVARGTRVTVGQAEAYQPVYFLSSLLPGLPSGFVEPIGGAIGLNGLAAARVEYQLDSSSEVGLSHTFSERTTLSVGGRYQQVRTPSHDRELTAASGRGDLRFGLSRHLGFRLGYTHMEAHTRGSRGGRTRVDSADAGLTYDRALSLTRNTTFSFSTGSSAVTYRGTTRFFVTGAAALNREIARTWVATLGYSRNTGFLGAFEQPVFWDSLGFSVRGQLNRRMQLSTTMGALQGSVGLTGPNRGYRAAFGTVGLNIGVTRNVGLGIDYSAYWYEFDQGVSLPAGVFAHVRRQSVRMMVNLWTPLVSRTRSPHASR